MKPARILIVDSSSDTTEAVSLLKKAGYDVEVAGNESRVSVRFIRATPIS